MATPNQYVQAPTLYLAGSGTVPGATSLTVTSFSDILGNVLTMASFGSTGYGSAEPETSNEESFTFSSVTANSNGTYTLGGIKSSLAQSPYTQSVGLVRSHGGGQPLVISDTAAFWNTFANKANDEVITGSWTFNTAPVALSVTTASTSVLGNTKLTSTPFTTKGTCTISIATPAVITFASHGLIAGDSVQFTTTGALPTGITAGTPYYVIAAGLATNTFEISTSPGGSAVNTSGTQSGTQTLIRTTPFAVGNEDTRLPTQGENDALVGTGGTPSSSNKYVTQQGTTTTPVSGGVPQLDSNGLIPAALTNHSVIGIDTTQKLRGTSYTIAIPGGTLGTNQAIRFRLLVSTSSLPSSGDQIGLTATYGGSSVGTFNYTLGTGTTFLGITFLEGVIFANASTSAQKAMLSVAGTFIGSNGSQSGTFYTAPAVDSTVSQNLVITTTFSVNGNIVLDGIVVSYL